MIRRILLSSPLALGLLAAIAQADDPAYSEVIVKTKAELKALQEYYEDDSDLSEKPDAWTKEVRPGFPD